MICCFAAVALDFGAITSSSNFFLDNVTWTGIMGLAYRGIAAPNDNPIAPPMDAFYAHHPALPDVFSLQLCNVKNNEGIVEDRPSSMVLGGVDSAMFASHDAVVHYTRVLGSPRTFYHVEVVDVAVGEGDDASLDLACSMYNSPEYSIVDSGTTDVLLPHVVYDAIVARIADAPLHLPGATKPTTFREYLRDTLYTSSETGVDDLVDGFFAGDDGVCIEMPAAVIHRLPNIYISFAALDKPGKVRDGAALTRSDHDGAPCCVCMFARANTRLRTRPRCS